LSTSIDDAIAAAKASANAMTPAAISGGSLPATPARKLTMADLDAGSIDVATWLQVDEYGLHLAKTKDTFETIDFEIDLDEVVACLTVRYGKNPAQYKKSYDGVTTFGSGESWEVTLRKAQSIDSTCRGAYSSAEVPMVLVNDVTLVKGEGKKIEAGTRVGFAPSVTGFKNFKRFWDEAVEKGYAKKTARVRVGYEVKKSNGNEWGVATFTLLTN
jgi:hypothetical protein